MDGSRLHVRQRHGRNGVHVAPGSSGVCTNYELAGYLHYVSALLLRDEEAGYSSDEITVESALAAVCGVDDPDFAFYYFVDGWLYHFYSRAVSSVPYFGYG